MFASFRGGVRFWLGPGTRLDPKYFRQRKAVQHMLIETYLGGRVRGKVNPFSCLEMGTKIRRNPGIA